MVSALVKLLRHKSTDGGLTSHGGTVEIDEVKMFFCLKNQLRINPFWYEDREGGFGSDVCQRVWWTARRKRSFELGYSNLSISWASIVMQAVFFEVPWASRLLQRAMFDAIFDAGSANMHAWPNVHGWHWVCRTMRWRRSSSLQSKLCSCSVLDLIVTVVCRAAVTTTGCIRLSETDTGMWTSFADVSTSLDTSRWANTQKTSTIKLRFSSVSLTDDVTGFSLILCTTLFTSKLNKQKNRQRSKWTH